MITESEKGFKDIFKQGRIIGFAGNKNTGKTNNLICLIKRFREENKTTPVYVYGMEKSVISYLKQYNIKEIDSLKQLITKESCLLILDEFQRLKLNDRRYKDIKDEFADYVYHKNVYVILTSPNIREFNSVADSIIEGWLIKSIDIDDCINGSKLKHIVDNYTGEFKTLGCIDIPKDKILLINDNESMIIHCDYIPEADTKKDQLNLFLSSNCQNKSQEIVKERIIKEVFK